MKHPFPFRPRTLTIVLILAFVLAASLAAPGLLEGRSRGLLDADGEPAEAVFTATPMPLSKAPLSAIIDPSAHPAKAGVAKLEGLGKSMAASYRGGPSGIVHDADDLWPSAFRRPSCLLLE